MDTCPKLSAFLLSDPMRHAEAVSTWTASASMGASASTQDPREVRADGMEIGRCSCSCSSPCFFNAHAQKPQGAREEARPAGQADQTTSALLAAGKRSEKPRSASSNCCRRPIRQRQELINTMNSECFRVDKEIGETEDLIGSLETDLGEAEGGVRAHAHTPP